MDERKNNMLKQNKKREKQKKTHENELESISKYIKEVRNDYFYIEKWTFKVMCKVYHRSEIRKKAT